MNKISEQIALEITDKLGEYKAFAELVTKAAEKDTGTFRVIITTENVDRMGEVIKADGWDMSHYLNNPIVLWGHDHRALPIGVTTNLFKEGTQWVAEGRFAPEAANPVGQHVRRLYDLGIQRATSVGFIAREMEGNVITKAELLEFSFVSVPANPMCLSTMVKSGLSIDEYVAKGFLTIEVKEEATEEVPAEAPVETPAEEVPVEKKDDEPSEEELEKIEEDEVLGDEQDITEDDVDLDDVKSFIDEIRKSVSALEALLIKGEELERKEDDETEEETPEVKAHQKFLEARRFTQQAATALSESLAASRVALSSKR